MQNDCLKIKALLPYLITNKEQEEMTEKARKSLMSFEHCLSICEDGKKYEDQVAGVWNVFLDTWRGKKYDYLLITANDVEHDPMMVDYLVRCMEENPSAGIVSVKCTRDLEEFKKGYGQQQYTSELTTSQPKDPATFMIRKGVIEKVGRVDATFKTEFVERDFIYRCKLAGYDWVQPDVVLEYHPPYAGTIGNDRDRLHRALVKYVNKWGNDANKEIFTNPYNNLNFDYTYCGDGSEVL